jgi:hypothetical protein
MKTEKVLLQWDSNWADEMDIYGFSIMNKSEWEAYKKMLANKGEFYIYVGTNEEIEYSKGQELLNEISVKNITEEESKTIQKFFGGEGGFTNFLGLDEDEDEDEDWEDEDDDDED